MIVQRIAISHPNVTPRFAVCRSQPRRSDDPRAPAITLWIPTVIAPNNLLKSCSSFDLSLASWTTLFAHVFSLTLTWRTQTEAYIHHKPIHVDIDARPLQQKKTGNGPGLRAFMILGTVSRGHALESRARMARSSLSCFYS